MSSARLVGLQRLSNENTPPMQVTEATAAVTNIHGRTLPTSTGMTLAKYERRQKLSSAKRTTCP